MNLVDLADDADSQMHPTHERFLQNVTAHASSPSLGSLSSRFVSFKLSGDRDPVIPIKPSLDSHFALDKAAFRLHALPYLAFGREFARSLQASDQLHWPDEADYLKKKAVHVLFLLVDEPPLFKHFFNQVPYEATQYNVLNCLFLNSNPPDPSFHLTSLN